jgi:hypothetical protein
MSTNVATYLMDFRGGVLRRGFWLYVWVVAPPKGPRLYYVGRTGDSSAIKAQSPFNRMGQHLGFAENSNMLRRYLRLRGVKPEQCSFRLIAYGPLLKEARSRKLHHVRRDIVAALEKALAEAMTDAGYTVMNTVKCRKVLDPRWFLQVRRAFATRFPRLG